MIFAFLTLAASLVLIGKHLRMPWLNPLTALALPWVVVMLIASLPGSLSPRLTPELWTMVWAGFTATAVGSIVGWLLTIRRVSVEEPVSTVDVPRLRRMHKLLTVALAGYGILQAIDAWPVLQRLGGVGAIFSSSSALGNEYKYQYSQGRLETTSSSLDGASFLMGSLGYVLFLGHISLFTGAVLWRSGHRLLASLPLILAGAYSLFSLQRTSFFMCFLIFVATYIYSRAFVRYPNKSHNIPNKALKKGKVAATLVSGTILIPVLLYPIQQRNAATGNSTGFESLAQYLLSSIAGLNQRLDANMEISTPPAAISGELAPSPGYGSYTFTGLFTLLRRLGIPVPVAPHSLDYYSVEIFGSTFTTNTGTSYLDFYLDFGWVGVIVIAFGLGLLAASSLGLYVGGRIWVLPILVMLTVSIFWSFFVNALMGDFRYLYLAILASAYMPWILYGENMTQTKRKVEQYHHG